MRSVKWEDEASDRDVVEAIRRFTMDAEAASKALRSIWKKPDPLTAPWSELVEKGN
jgi:hypothetical protein